MNILIISAKDNRINIISSRNESIQINRYSGFFVKNLFLIKKSEKKNSFSLKNKKIKTIVKIRIGKITVGKSIISNHNID